MLLELFYLILGGVLLWRGADWTVDNASIIARRFGISELIIGLTIVAMGTSAPEFLVTTTAAFKGLSDISLANIVGSNIFNLGIILGTMAILRPIPTHRTLVFRDGLLLWGITIIITLMSLNHRLGRLEGALLLILFFSYLAYLLYNARKSHLTEKKQNPTEHSPEKCGWPVYLKLVGGIVAISLGSDLLVDAASYIAAEMGVSQWAIGLTIVAAGTSLPELVTCLSAGLKGRNEMLLGNLIGSDFFNFAGVLGVTCLLRPLEVSPSALPSLYILVGVIFLVLIFMRTGWKLSRWEGALLIAINLWRWGMEFH